MSLVVNLEDIQFSYGKDSKNFLINSLKINEGERVFIHGPSGSGKSTLLNLIAGILVPSSGRLEVLGNDFTSLSSLKRDKVRGSDIGYIFQSFNLIPYLTSYENIILPLKSSKTRRSRVDDETEFVDRISSRLGIKDELHKNIKELSIGQQQRVAVARALAGEPRLIIADEPTSSLDNSITDEFIKLILKEHERQNFTLVFVSHDIELSKYFDRVVEINSLNGADKC